MPSLQLKETARLDLKEIEELKGFLQFNQDGFMLIELMDETPETISKVYALLDWKLEYNIKNKSNRHLDISVMYAGEHNKSDNKVNYLLNIRKGVISITLEVVANAERAKVV